MFLVEPLTLHSHVPWPMGDVGVNLNVQFIHHYIKWCPVKFLLYLSDDQLTFVPVITKPLPNIKGDECYQVHNLNYDNKLSNFQWVEMPWRPCDVRVMCIHGTRVKSMAIFRSYLLSFDMFLANHIAWRMPIVLTITITYTADLRQPNTDDADKQHPNIIKSFSPQVPVPL